MSRLVSRESVRRANALMVALHVAPRATGGWALRRSGTVRALRIFGLKREAVSAAINEAGRQAMRLFIHRRDGTVQRVVGK